MRILAFSDVVCWESYQDLVDQWEPDIVALAGDLTSDGGAAFWHTALEAIPAFRHDMDVLRKKLGVRVSPSEDYDIIPQRSHDEYHDARSELERRHQASKAFQAARKQMHVTKFYSFLRYAGRRSSVLVVKGDHDDDFTGDYVPRKINSIPGCHEISGRVHSVDGISFLGVGFDQAAYRRPLRRIVAEQRGQVKVVIAHSPQENVRIVAELKPSLLIRGHFGWGTYFIDGVPSVFTAGHHHAIVDIRPKKVPRIRVADDDPLDPTSTNSLRKKYPWLLPYEP